MAPIAVTFSGGLLMGLASSLHCAGMCGGIATSVMFGFARGSARTHAHFAAQTGRILVYITSGALLGGFGGGLYGAFDHPSAYLVMRWAAAASLGWIGFSVIGLAPSLAALDRFTAPLSRALQALRPPPGAGAFISGMIWGLLPCGMVYGALFYAMLSGGALGGAEVMGGFGLGTLPAVTAVAFGAARLRRFAAIPRARIAVGLGIIALAAASVGVPAIAAGILCLP